MIFLQLTIAILIGISAGTVTGRGSLNVLGIFNICVHPDKTGTK